MPKPLKSFTMLILPLIALILELLPFSFPFVSAGGPNVRHKAETSYWAPFYIVNAVAPLTLVLTAALIFSVIIYVFIIKKEKFLFGVSAVTAVISFLAMLYSVFAWIDRFTVISVIIALLLCAESLFIYCCCVKNNAG